MLPKENMSLVLPKVDKLEWPATVFVEPKLTFDFPRDTFLFLDTLKIQVFRDRIAV